jgi:hypothetical protein
MRVTVLFGPRRRLRSSVNDLYPTAIAPSDNLGAINEELTSHGGYLRFLYTSN